MNDICITMNEFMNDICVTMILCSVLNGLIIGAFIIGKK